MTATLHVFALNTDPGIRHTNLTRAGGEAPDLPPLAGWLGLGALEPGEIELFPVDDLGDMRLSDYITAAFAPEDEIAGSTQRRLDALDGSVLLVPGDAMTGTPAPGPEATQVAEIALARPDNSMDMAPVSVLPGEVAAPDADPTPKRTQRAGRGGVVWVLFGAAIVGVALWILL